MREDWIECELEEVCDIYAGVGFPKNKQGKVKGDIPFYKVGDISKNVKAGNRYLKLCDNYIDKGDIPKIENKLLPPNSIVFAKIGEALKLNRRSITVDYSLVDNNAIGIKANKLLIDLFLYFFFLTVQLEKYSRATTVPSVRKSDIESIKFLLAPLVEQKAIVKKIEELFSSLDSGIADLKKAQDQLKIYRQAVLKKAFEGKLTNISKKINFVSLGSIIEKPKYGTSKKCSLDGKGIAVLRIPNIKNGTIDKTELKYAEFEEKEISNLALKKGDILTIRSNGSVDLVGKCALITKNDLKYLYAGYLIRLRPDIEKIDSKYLLHCLSSHDLRVQIESKAKSTSGVNNINSGELQSLEIPLFSLKEQHQIVREIESRLSVCDNVEESIKESLQKAQALRQSILKKAFEGSLLNEVEVAKCKADKDYESASVLLERVKKDKLKK